MAEPARVLRLDDHRILSPEAQEALVARVEELSDIERAQNAAMANFERTIRRLKREIEDLLEEAADAETVRTCLEFWITMTGRDPKRTRIPLSGGRARDCRWVIRTHGKGAKGARAFCLAVIGLCASEWHASKGFTEVKHLCRDDKGYAEDKVQRFILAGLAARGLTR